MLDRMGADSLDELGAGHPGSTSEAAPSKDGNRRRIEHPFAVKPPQRLRELDSLRGVASLTVVWHHWVWIFRDAVVPWYILPFVSGREAVILRTRLRFGNLRAKRQSGAPIEALDHLLLIHADYIRHLV